MDEEKKKLYKDKGIIVSGDALDRELLSDIVTDFVRIYAEGEMPEIVFTASGDALSAKNKLLVFLLGRKIAFDSQLIERESMTAAEITEATHMKGGTVRPYLQKLLDTRLVVKDADGAYYVPNYSLKQIGKEIKGGE